MTDQVKILCWLGLAFLALFGLCEWLFHRWKWDAEHTRKVAHAGAGLMSLSFPLLLTDCWQVLLLCGAFLLILAITKYQGWLRSIHAISRVSFGSTMFPLVVAICFWRFSQTQNLLHFYLPVLVMALADPAACLVGRKYPVRRMYLNKSLGGAIAFFIVAFLLTLLLQSQFEQNVGPVAMITRAFMVGSVTTTAEALSGKGFDNFSIPMAALLVI